MSEAQLLRLLNSAVLQSKDAILITDAQLAPPGPRVVFANPAFTRLTGYAAGEIIGRTPRILQGPQTDRSVLRQLRQNLERSEAFEGQVVNYRKDGSEFTMEFQIAPLHNEAGEVSHFVAIQRDITERKRSEILANRLAAIVESSQDAIIGKDLNGTVTSWNAGAEKIFGYSAAQMIGQPIRRLIPAERQEEETEILRRIQRGENVPHFETVRLRSDGSPVPVAMTVSAIRDSAGNIVGASKVARDIGASKRAAAELQSVTARLLHLLEHSPAVIYAIRIEGEQLVPYLVSENMIRLLGFAVPETLSHEWWARQLHPEDRDRALQSVSDTLASGQSRTEYRMFHKNGTMRWVDDNRRLIRDAAGQPAEFVGVWTDITERKSLESQFLRAQRMESIGTLAGGIAHDLNNILAPILMSIELLKKMSANAESTELLETIQSSAQRGADIVRQVLSFARGMEGERVKVQIRHLCSDIKRIIHDTFPKDIRTQFTVPVETWTVLGDPTQIYQVLLNVCLNARDAMPHGGSLTISAENSVLDERHCALHIQAKPGHYVVLSVTDSGSGIPPNIIDKIFEPFFTTKAPNKGTGLGLSTAAAIVKSHGGFINVYSELGKGTTVKLYLPAADLTADAGPEAPDQAGLPRGNGETVLLVDDEASILTITSQTLLAFGYRVLTATDGADALAVYVQHRSDIALVVVDMMMPVMDGAAAIHALLRINPQAKIIATSGLQANGGVHKATGSGVKAFLMKPYTAATLLKSVRARLDET